MTLDRRIDALEAQAENADDDAPVDWGPGFEHLPPTTKGGLRIMLKAMHDSGAGRLRPVTLPATAGATKQRSLGSKQSA